MELREARLNLKTALLTMMMFKWGILCTATSDKCLSAPCQNGATCVDTVDDYACVCAKEGVRHMGKNCDELYDACSFAPCEVCQSILGSSEYHCICPEGLTGDNCTEEVDECQSNPCLAPHSLCVDQPNGFFCRCPLGFGGWNCQTHITDCNDEPCMNNGTCVVRPEGFECHCEPGFEGRSCEENVDECLSEPCQNGALCVDGLAEFHCYCVPGFQGYNCEIDINECASRPCENNGTCINEKDHYECECLLGFTGVNCETEMDECQSNPCRHGATCHDLIGMYSCECPPGFTGIDCEVDVDECASGPCQNRAVCRDLVNGYECDCSDTGFEGSHCEVDVLECASDPCQHGATCVEGIKGYTCLCWPGYEGLSCEEDVDECATQPCEHGGECFERSDPSHWDLEWQVSFADAAGYICQCQPGFAGENCSVDIEECESEPCQNGGVCQDKVNGYTCECPVGFLGELCEVNVDECVSQPCHNGWCEDGRASFTCHCFQPTAGQLPWGGDQCEVQLRGCISHKCQNGATCLPWLDNGQDGHTCVCPHGFYNDQCSTRTTFSFPTPTFIHVQVPLAKRRQRGLEQQDHGGLQIQLRFRTTLSNMLLFFRGDAANYLLLEIVDGGLHAKAVSEESEWDVAYRDSVSDGEWQEAHLLLNKGLVLVLKGPGCDRSKCEVVDDGAEDFQLSEALANMYIGGAPEELLQFSVSAAGFVGCIEDLMIDLKPFLPNTLPEDQPYEPGCSKTEWCSPDPCHGHGRCVDLWTSYQCDCQRPFHGDSCSQEHPSWTFSHEDSLSYSVHDIRGSHGRTFNVSFLLRTLKPNGLLFQLWRPSSGEAGHAYFSIYLWMGRVLVRSLLHGAALTAPVFVASGEKELLQVEVRHSRVVFAHAGLRYDIGELPEVNIESGDQAYVGGLPSELDSSVWGGHFKGCLQDLRLDSVGFQMDGGNRVNDEEHYAAHLAKNIKKDCISDDTCKVKPCKNGGRCTVTFNDFLCTCPKEYVGKICSTRVWCVGDPCVSGGECVDLHDGYECVHNATFDNSPVQYSAGGSLREPVAHIYMELRSRSENAVLLRGSWDSDFLMVGLLDSSIHVEIRVGASEQALSFNGVRRVADGSWHRVEIFQSEGERKVSPWVITVDGITDSSSSPELTGRIGFLSEKEAVLTIADSFTGCLGAIRLGGVYLPFVEDYRAPQLSQFHFVGKAEIPLGCRSAPVCGSEPCLNGATCSDLFNAFSCECDLGWEGELCDTDTDDCAAQPCVHGSCKDYLAGFECRCHPGYVGTLCDRDLDECQHHACEHGGICKDGVNTYTCVCPENYRGPLCQWIYPPEECGKHVRCANDGVCNDGPWGANCTCEPGFTGSRCETEINECASNPCQNGGSCLDRFNMFVCDCPPNFSGPVCDINKLVQSRGVPWLMITISLLCFCILVLIMGLTFMVLTARKKRKSEGAYSPSTQEVAGARLEMDSMLKVPPEERLI